MYIITLSGCYSVSYSFQGGKKRAAKVAVQYVGKLSVLIKFAYRDVVDNEAINDE